MARMLPATLPKRITAGEADVYRLLRDAPGSDGWICLHSLGLARHERKDYAEADFVVIAPAGIFCIEVKGGEVRREAGRWEIGWPGKTYFSNEGPFKQAQGTRWALSKHLESKVSPQARRDFLLGWGVAFPDIVFSQSDPEWDQEVVFDRRDKGASFGTYLARLERYFRGRLEATGRKPPPRLGPAQIGELGTVLRGDFEVVPSLAGLIAEAERELISLTPQQFAVLDFALNEENPRILCEGAAGTGKTLVAMEAARRLARSGRKVLLLCFNENLNHFLKVDSARDDERFEVRTLYALLGDIIRRGGYGAELNSAFATSGRDAVFEEAYPRLFETACLALIEEGQLPLYDALVIDEAQDLMTAPLMNCLDLILNDGFAAGRWAVFYDSGLQAGLYGRMAEPVIGHLRGLGAAKFSLKDNFRNPRTIVAEMCAVTEAPMPVCRREIPSPVDYRVFDDEREQAKKLRALLLDLMRAGLRPGRISILSAVAEEASCVARFPPEVGKAFQNVASDPSAFSEDRFSVGTISGFKGLENDVIILTDITKATDGAWLRSLLYVGMTRARAKLFALVGREFYEARFES